jgi:putative ABC transport system permease protein
MTLKIILRNLVHRPASSLLSVLLLMLSTGIIAMLLQLKHQLSRKLDNDLRDIDMVVGAKGSPLQLVLSAVYHVDAPTGNIDMIEAKRALRSPFVESVIPLAYGDSYRGFRIVGTDSSLVGKYQASLAAGHLFNAPMEVVLGSTMAQRTKLSIGDSMVSQHGEGAKGTTHEGHPYRVTGILHPTNTAIDNLAITSVESIWLMHDDHAESSDTANAHRQWTAALVKFRSPMGLMMLPRTINENTNLMAAIPALEVNRLLSLMGIGIATMQAVALAIMVIAAISVFIALYNRLKERKYEHALLRTMGCSRLQLLAMILAEGLALAIAGCMLGLLLSRIGMVVLNTWQGADLHFTLTYRLLPQEAGLFAVTCLTGIFAALIPALKAFNINLSKTLANA